MFRLLLPSNCGTESRIARRIAFNTDRLEAFLSGRVNVLPFDDGDARAAGGIRANLEVSGRIIGPYDLLIAGQALARQFTLVTANVSEFPALAGIVMGRLG